MSIVVHYSIGVLNVSVHRFVAQRTVIACHVADLVRRLKEIVVNVVVLVHGVDDFDVRSLCCMPGDILQRFLVEFVLAVVLGIVFGKAWDLAGWLSHGRWLRWETHLLGVPIGINTGIIAHVSRLIHINPSTINVYAVLRIEHFLETLGPVRGSIGMEPVWPDRDAGPNDSSERVSGRIGRLQEDIHLHALIVGTIVILGNCRIHHQDVVLLTAVQPLDKALHLGRREPLWIERECPSEMHVINVRPHHLKRNTGCGVVVDNFSDVEPILVTKLALLETQTPVGDHCGQSD
jgi:hypothetical protein